MLSYFLVFDLFILRIYLHFFIGVCVWAYLRVLRRTARSPYHHDLQSLNLEGHYGRQDSPTSLPGYLTLISASHPSGLVLETVDVCAATHRQASLKKKVKDWTFHDGNRKVAVSFEKFPIILWSTICGVPK